MISPERRRVWSEPKAKGTGERRVPVVYYLCRNGQLDHPHFIEVPLSSTHGLYLRDVIKRLNELRGKGMASMYSWSSKRGYHNGFVWHDLSENDFIYPANGQEYVLKGSEVLLNPSMFQAPRFQEQSLTGESAHFLATPRRRNQSWSSIDISEYKVFKAAESCADSTRKLAANASTQTDDRMRRRKPRKERETEESSVSKCPEAYENQSTEMAREEISLPPPDRSPETLESTMEAEGRQMLSGSARDNEDRSIRGTADEECISSGRTKASAVLMRLILKCGTMSFRDRCGGPRSAGAGKTGVLGFAGKETGAEKEFPNFAGIKLEDKEYFSGSLIETKKKLPPPSLKRSASYSAERNSRAEKEIDDVGVAGKRIPRKSKVGNEVNMKQFP